LGLLGETTREKKTLKLHLKKKNGGLSEEYFFPTFKGVEKEKKGL
jgi:hypothetical protein